ncbi:MAG: helicase, partial [Chloroflexi bacterium]|nr:helicase [Chloroflexota bacterium]
TDLARFAVGYFFLSGLEALADVLDGVQEMRLLIGNATNRQTIEQIAEGYQSLAEAGRRAEAERYRPAAEAARMARAAAEALAESAELMDQSDEAELAVSVLADLIAEGRLHVRIYTRGRLHAKAYICTYGRSYTAAGRPLPTPTSGIAVVGSSNLSLAGITTNTELNVLVHGDANHAALVDWFDALWEEAEPFDEHLMEVLAGSWAQAEVTPYEVYLKTLYELARERLEVSDAGSPLWDDDISEALAEFQRAAVQQAIGMVNAYGGCFVADVVGLGKSYIGAALLKHYVMHERSQPLIVCPAPLQAMWEGFNARYNLNAHVLSMGYLREHEVEGDQWLRDHPVYRHCDLVLVDESHNFRSNESQRYRVLQTYLGANDRRAVFLTATPRNTSAMDIYHQIKLFHQQDLTQVPVDPPDLREFFRLVEEGQRRLPDLLGHLLIRRRRRDVLRQYGYDAETDKRIDPEEWAQYRSGKRRAYVQVGGRKQFFPKRVLETIRYSIEDTYSGLYDDIRLRISGREGGDPHADGSLCYARYGLGRYVLPKRQREPRYKELQRVGPRLGGLMRTMLFKRFESSVEAFRATVRRMRDTHGVFLAALREGIVPAGEDAERLLHEADRMDEAALFEALEAVCSRYDASDFHIERLMADIAHDIGVLEEVLRFVDPIDAHEDDKLQALRKVLQSDAFKSGKRLIFTQFADTARYLYENLADLDDALDVVYSGNRDLVSLVARFAPKANAEAALTAVGGDIDLLVATDVLSEGLNLQDCDRLINYDLHWNPVRLIQRLGRIDRIGSEHDRIQAWSFLPETALEENLGLRASLSARIQEIHDTIGEDAAILDPSERVNEDAMYAIYEGHDIEQFEADEEGEGLLDLSEAEEIIRRLREQDPEMFERITSLADGIRCGRRVGVRETYVFCRAGRYRRLYLLDEEGSVLSSETPKVLAWLRCEPDTPSEPLPADHNGRVMEIKAAFDAEVEQREAGLRHRTEHTAAQRALLREVRAFRNETEDERLRDLCDRMEEAFRGHIVRPAIRREMNRLRREGTRGEILVRELARIHALYRMDLDGGNAVQQETDTRDRLPRIVCSEAGLP